MRKIAIVGAGQSGLQLGIGLRRKGYEVTIVTDRSGDAVHNGRVLSSQCMFDAALDTERDLGLDYWEETCPPIEGIGLLVVGPEGSPVIEWDARLSGPARSVDQRVKVPVWMAEFERIGGNLQFDNVGVEGLEQLSETNDLVVVASGKGEIGRLFERDESRSTHEAPQRVLALTYVEGYREWVDYSTVLFNLIPTVGEYFWFPALSTTGPCHIMVFEGIPGGPMDCWDDVSSPEEHLDRSRQLLEQLMPWEAERARDIRLTDPNGVLAGRFTPTVRHPVAVLPSGREVFGMADVVVLNDPITGQGSNNAAKCADLYLAEILARGGEPFDRDWMEATFESFWTYAEDVVRWTDLLLAPPADHLVALLGAAGQIPGLASRIVNGFNHPPDFFPWWEDADEGQRLLEREQAALGLETRSQP